MNAPKVPGDDRPRPKPPADLTRVPRQPVEPTAARLAVSSDPVISVSRALLHRFNARLLNPATAVKVKDQSVLQPTVYIADKLIVSGAVADDSRDALTAAAKNNKLQFVPPLDHAARRDTYLSIARDAGHDDPESMFPTLAHLEPLPGEAAPVDAWEVLQGFRAIIGKDHPGQQHVALDHLLSATKHIAPSPLDTSGLATASVASYGEPGWGGRGPVNWLGASPPRRDDLPGRRPVVAVLDTGCGQHPWFANGEVRRNPTVDDDPNGTLIGLLDNGDDPEDVGVLIDPLEGVLDPDSGHGTFISGLIRQLCPDADILAVRIMPSAGAVPEHALLDALNLLACRQKLALQTGNPALLVDVVSLSLGYYHEQPEDIALDHFLLQPLDALARMGVAVVVSAGNDATTRPMFPAAFVPHPGGVVASFDPDCVPITSVGATNPDGTIALFSNAGPWVACHRPGADLVSTFPTTFDASAQPRFRVDAAGGPRATLDPDNFASGFGTWSGTSFAAPVLAGEIAQTLVDGKCGSLDDSDAGTCVARGWAAVSAHTDAVRP